MFDWKKPDLEPLDPKNPLLDGSRITIARDPEDPRYDIITFRRVGNIVSGGPSRPECDIKGIAAVRRWVRLIIAEAMGHVVDNRQATRALEAVHKRFHDPS